MCFSSEAVVSELVQNCGEAPSQGSVQPGFTANDAAPLALPWPRLAPRAAAASAIFFFRLLHVSMLTGVVLKFHHVVPAHTFRRARSQ